MQRAFTLAQRLFSMSPLSDIGIHGGIQAPVDHHDQGKGQTDIEHLVGQHHRGIHQAGFKNVITLRHGQIQSDAQQAGHAEQAENYTGQARLRLVLGGHLVQQQPGTLPA